MSNVIQLPIKRKSMAVKKQAPKVQLWVRVDQADHEKLQSLAEQSNMSLANYMRSMVGFVIKEEWQMSPAQSVEAI